MSSIPQSPKVLIMKSITINFLAQKFVYSVLCFKNNVQIFKEFLKLKTEFCFYYVHKVTR